MCAKIFEQFTKNPEKCRTITNCKMRYTVEIIIFPPFFNKLQMLLNVRGWYCHAEGRKAFSLLMEPSFLFKSTCPCQLCSTSADGKTSLAQGGQGDELQTSIVIQDHQFYHQEHKRKMGWGRRPAELYHLST